MRNPELDVRRVSTASEDKLFLDLAAPFLRDTGGYASTYRLRHIVPFGNDGAYAVYEENHNVLPVRFYLNDELLIFGDDEDTQLMSLDEIRLMRELGEVVIDDTLYSIESTNLRIVDALGGCRHMVVFGLKNKE